MEQRKNETLGSCLTRFDAAVVVVQKPDPSIVLMTVVARVANKIEFKKTLKRHPPKDLVDFLLSS